MKSNNVAKGGNKMTTVKVVFIKQKKFQSYLSGETAFILSEWGQTQMLLDNIPSRENTIHPGISL